MDILYACCAGLDVHKETVVATVRRRLDSGKVQRQTRTFGTMTQQLLEQKKGTRFKLTGRFTSLRQSA